MSRPLPFVGVTVVDLTCDVGELCGRILAELGAYVIKVTADALRLAAQRYLTIPDAVRIIREAAQSDVGARR